MASKSRYWDYDAIFADEERIPVVWKRKGIRCGYLDPSIATEDVDPGTRMELPLWLAEDLSAAGDVAIELPVGYGIKSREELRATARTVRLRDRSPAFYTNGLKLSKLCVSEEAQKLSEDVHHVMADRVNHVLSSAQDRSIVDSSAFTDGLSDLEQTLYLMSKVSAADRRLWRTGGKRVREVHIPAVTLARLDHGGWSAVGGRGAGAGLGGGGVHAGGGVAVEARSSSDIIAAASRANKAIKRQ